MLPFFRVIPLPPHLIQDASMKARSASSFFFFSLKVLLLLLSILLYCLSLPVLTRCRKLQYVVTFHLEDGYIFRGNRISSISNVFWDPAEWKILYAFLIFKTDYNIFLIKWWCAAIILLLHKDREQELLPNWFFVLKCFMRLHHNSLTDFDFGT